nr:SH3 domain-containing protein [Adlercreutzia caecimuris]
MKWRVGDILVSNTHAVVVVAGAAAGDTGVAIAVSGSIEELARAVIAGRYGVGDARRAALGDKYAAVQARVNELLSGTANAAGTSTGTARIIAGEYKVVCSKLYVRSTPSRKLQPVADYSNGQRIYSVAADVVEAEGYVWAHYTAYSGATRYVAIGTADGSEKFLVKV